ncbi:Hypothetical protein SMAX5B_004394 [Scophthalmus maximus]|uniref:Uncharacterized protein n=1 Tax=Scophthalmus maximus TaxID=52904 RepID=A0A2U9CQZ7_SCOMX|nr:Hypothetical protein SMAX5B_004394 [Scophthalmus maximus]
MQAQHLGAETCRHPDLVMQQEVMRGMAIAPGPEITGHSSGPDMMTDPVVMPPVPWPGPDMMKDRGDVMYDPVVMPPVRSRHDDRTWHSNLSSPPMTGMASTKAPSLPPLSLALHSYHASPDGRCCYAPEDQLLGEPHEEMNHTAETLSVGLRH